jgi:predicted ATP-dependent endonuclease of OLD family
MPINIYYTYGSKIKNIGAKMKIEKFQIQNYRAIENVEVDLKHSINPIIGINESGKTSVLNAILAFDKGRDKLSNGGHLKFQNKYSTGDTHDSEITAYIKLTEQEIKDLLKTTKSISLPSNDNDELLKFNKDTVFILKRILSSEKKEYKYINSNLSEEINIKIKSYLVNHLPFILYFDDFTDRVPALIEFKDYKTTGKLKGRKRREWQEIIEEIFKRVNPDGAKDGKTPLQGYMNTKDEDRKSGMLNDIQDELNKEIIEEWKRIKKSGKSFADDSSNLELVIENSINDQFKFKVRDSSSNSKRVFAISERSKGFQWFFNYMIKLKFNPNYKKDGANALFLLDEPGSYLHSSAQIELLNELKRVSEKNTIIFCTHSQFLLNPTIIKLSSIKIAEKNKSKITLNEFAKYKTKKDKGALTPIYHSLNLNFSHDFVGKLIITEGITDYYLLKLLQLYQNKIDKSIKVIPGTGAKQLSTLLSFAIPFSDNFICMLDNDTEGREAYDLYKKEFGERISSKLHIFHSKKSNFCLEDFLSHEDALKIKTLTKCEDLKRCLELLYNDYKDCQQDFINNLNKETLSNLEDIYNGINLL